MSKVIFNFPTAAKRFEVNLPCQTADSLFIAQTIVSDQTNRQNYVILCADAANAQRLYAEVSALLPQFNCLFLPDWETLAYDQFSPPQALISDRLATLYQLITVEKNVLFLSINTALNPVPPRSFLAASSFSLVEGQTLDSEKLRQQLVLAGYNQVTNVLGHGEFSVRGSLFDLYPMGAALPLRLDLFGQEIDSIKAFDPDTQRSLFPLKQFNTLPAHEFPLDDSGRSIFRQNFRSQFEGDPSRKEVYKQVSQGHAPAGIEYYLPLFFTDNCNIFDYISNNCGFFCHGNIADAAADFWQECRRRYENRKGDASCPVLPPEQLFLSEENLFSYLQKIPRLHLKIGDNSTVSNYAKIYSKPPVVAINQRHVSSLADLQTWLAQFPGRVVLVSETIGRRETLLSLLAENKIKVHVIDSIKEQLPEQIAPQLAIKHADHELLKNQKPASSSATNFASERQFICVAPFYFGCIYNPNGVVDQQSLAIISEAEIYANTPRRRISSRSKVNNDQWLRDLSELKIGDPVVHERHGVGRYVGLVSMEMDTGEIELLELHYANSAKLFVPVAQLQLISRYSGADADHAPLHQLGSGQWEKEQKKAALQVYDTAAQLLALYAQRAARRGHVFEYSASDYQAFADGFGFAETPDQAAAIEAVIADMRSDKPMDRLVCGDVGFGKTEVALRAAFCAVAGGKQVVVLTPTTLLCEQHFLTFKERFAEWPVNIVEMSRFRSSKEIKDALDGLAAGRIDIVIATHKIIASKVEFARLGLVIIDEEHRFGVRQKEKLKQMRAEVDILTLTATPIPRTLAISLEGLRDFSVIATAPEKRLPIKTFVTRDHDSIIREAILRELKRGGQVYFLHNEISTIEAMQRRLEKIVGEAKVIIGHGQMSERVLEQVMRDFTAQRANVLLCTTIIETGIDNPHANTIIIHHAEKFGLAQLHQLRGRVGRSHHQAFAYLLIDSEQSLSKQAKARLESLQSMEELGSGFYLAMHDMEIRGAGEVLGDNQSGEMHAIGFSRYNEMLNRAIASLKRGESLAPETLMRPVHSLCEINLYFPALIPDFYCPDVQERLNLYKALANANSFEQLSLLKEEMVDRFGVLPSQTEALMATHQVRLTCENLKFSRIEVTAKAGHFYFSEQFHESPSIDPAQLVYLIQNDRRFVLNGKEKLTFNKASNSLSERVAVVNDFFKLIFAEK